MTEQELQQIYDYLHENYRYEDGELIATKDLSPKQKSGSAAGYFWASRKTGHPIVVMAFPYSIKRKLQIPLAHCIYIYHNKCKPRYISYLDCNPVNTRIENLVGEEKRSLCYRSSNKIKNPKKLTKQKLVCGETYYVGSEREGEKIYIGRYLSKEESQKAYDYLRELLFNKSLSLKVIKEMVKNKYPVPYKKTNKLGFIGVRKYGKKYSAYITNKNQKIKLGNYDTPEEAHTAYLKAKEEYKNES